MTNCSPPPRVWFSEVDFTWRFHIAIMANSCLISILFLISVFQTHLNNSHHILQPWIPIHYHLLQLLLLLPSTYSTLLSTPFQVHWSQWICNGLAVLRVGLHCCWDYTTIPDVVPGAARPSEAVAFLNTESFKGGGEASYPWSDHYQALFKDQKTCTEVWSPCNIPIGMFMWLFVKSLPLKVMQPMPRGITVCTESLLLLCVDFISPKEEDGCNPWACAAAVPPHGKTVQVPILHMTLTPFSLLCQAG